MLGTELIRVEQFVYAQTLSILNESGIPEDLWPLVVDAAAGKVKDYSLAVISEQERDWRNKFVEKAGEVDARDDEQVEDVRDGQE